MSLSRLTAKSLMVGIKNGFTIEDFCAKYNCSEEQLRSHIFHIYACERQAQNMLSQILANGKKKEKKFRTADEADIETGVAAEETVSKPSELETLRTMEVEQSRKVIRIESDHKAEAEKHRALKKRVRTLNGKFEALLGEFQAAQTEFEAIMAENQVVEARMTELSAEWRNENGSLTAIRNRIEELSTLAISVYSNGEIVPMDRPEVKLDDSGHEVLKELLLMKDECQDLRVRDITVLARLLTIVDRINGKVEVLCDNGELEKAYKAIRNSTWVM